MTGRISDERFTELYKSQEASENAEKFMKIVRKNTNYEELTPTLLREFVEKIVIHESEALDGKRRGEVTDTENRSLLAFYANPDLRKAAPPQEQPQTQTLDLAALIEQFQKSPELTSTLASLIADQKAV